MKFSIESKAPNTVPGDLLAIATYEDALDSDPVVNQMDRKLGGLLKKLFKKEKFTGKSGQSRLIATQGKIPAENLLILGLGAKKKLNSEAIRKAGARVSRIAKQIRAAQVAVTLFGEKASELSREECAQALAEGMILATYEFTLYRPTPKDAPRIQSVRVLTAEGGRNAEVQRGVSRGEALAEGIFLARDLINTPANDMTPLDLARSAKGLKGVTTRVLSPAEIKKLKMGSYLGVSQGSIHPPAFIEMHYRPKGPIKKKVALVGKGVTFDSGGLSLKPPKFMETMKDDMAGAAAVIGLMSVVARLNLKVEVWGFVAATENMPDAMAIRPGDVIRAMNGKTIEVLNTDAEGRLTLADAICYADRKKPDYIIDTATLTGACLVALGDRISGIMGNDQTLVQKLIESGTATGENIWELPLFEEYREELKSPIADLKNIGGNYGGTINGGLFIQEFVGKNKWAHIDIAGPSWTEKPKEYESRGGTGVLVRTFAHFLAGF